MATHSIAEEYNKKKKNSWDRDLLLHFDDSESSANARTESSVSGSKN